jgi:hypothetical protein
MRGVTVEGFAYGLMATAYDRNGALPVVHPAISDRLSSADRALLNGSEELLLSNGWIEKTSTNECVLTDEGRAEVERRRQNNLIIAV